MQRIRGLAAAGYLVGAMLILLPLMDAVLSVSPPHVGDFRWRFGALGILANAIVIPTIGVALLLATSIGFGHDGRRRATGIFAFVVAVACLAALALFLLDAVQTQPAVRPEMKLSFRVAAAAACAKLVIGAIVFGTLGWVGARASGARRSPSEAPALLVGTPASARRAP